MTNRFECQGYVWYWFFWLHTMIVWFETPSRYQGILYELLFMNWTDVHFHPKSLLVSLATVVAINCSLEKQWDFTWFRIIISRLSNDALCTFMAMHYVHIEIVVMIEILFAQQLKSLHSNWYRSFLHSNFSLHSIYPFHSFFNHFLVCHEAFQVFLSQHRPRSELFRFYRFYRNSKNSFVHSLLQRIRS